MGPSSGIWRTWQRECFNPLSLFYKVNINPIQRFSNLTNYNSKNSKWILSIRSVIPKLDHPYSNHLEKSFKTQARCSNLSHRVCLSWWHRNHCWESLSQISRLWAWKLIQECSSVDSKWTNPSGHCEDLIRVADCWSMTWAVAWICPPWVHVGAMCDGTGLWSWHSGNRSRKIPRSKPAWAT